MRKIREIDQYKKLRKSPTEEEGDIGGLFKRYATSM